MTSFDPATKLLAFDYDGTIVSSWPLILYCFERCFAAHGLNVPSHARIKSVIGLELSQCFRILAPQADAQAMSKTYKKISATPAADKPSDQAFSGALESLQNLKAAGFTLSVCTGKNVSALKRSLTDIGLADFFFGLYTPDQAASKPAPDMLFQAMSAAGVEAKDTLVIGDARFDVQMANNAGVACLGVTWGYGNEDELRQAGACQLVSGWPAVTPYIDSHFAKQVRA